MKDIAEKISMDVDDDDDEKTCVFNDDNASNLIRRIHIADDEAPKCEVNSGLDEKCRMLAQAEMALREIKNILIKSGELNNMDEERRMQTEMALLDLKNCLIEFRSPEYQLSPEYYYHSPTSPSYNPISPSYNPTSVSPTSPTNYPSLHLSRLQALHTVPSVQVPGTQLLMMDQCRSRCLQFVTWSMVWFGKTHDFDLFSFQVLKYTSVTNGLKFNDNTVGLVTSRIIVGLMFYNCVLEMHGMLV
ncbi:hypothetical protein QVD17_02247 [Tagetes erecta]|uniref:Uncharacterized protein n=1 Tax=Tagetes erecta TaxID=13708 RepID=A0AAD8LDL5_TARER|nr:hypothetical protein QVD17_02247 [Tagetes erecta]